MSRFKRLRDLPDDLSELTVVQLERELRYWKGRAQTAASYANSVVRKLLTKRVHEMERLLEQKRRDEGIGSSR